MVDADFRVRRDKREAFLAMADALRGPDNALDVRSTEGGVNPETMTFARESLYAIDGKYL